MDLALEDISAVIPLRSGSKGLVGKNTRDLGGRPLYEHSLECARNAGITSINITTDIDNILASDLGSDVVAHRRPAALAQDTTPMADVLLNLFSNSVFDGKTIVLLQATSPLRRSEDVRKAILMYQTNTFDLIMSVCPAEKSILKYGLVSNETYEPMKTSAYLFANRQSLPEVFRPNGAIYVFNVDWFRHNLGFETTNIGAFKMSAQDSIDIDTQDDLSRCEEILQERQRKNK
jgi:CMP-N-acetylneuraminic acid synthetase